MNGPLVWSSNPFRYGGNGTTGNSLSHARQPYKCHDCDSTIAKGELYYRRSFDKAVYCMRCYKRRHDKWESGLIAEPRHLQAILEDLMKGACRANELQARHGGHYIGRIRKLKSLGYPIGRRRENGTVVWYLVQSSKRCQNCHRLITYVPIAGNAEPQLCESCSEK